VRRIPIVLSLALCACTGLLELDLPEADRPPPDPQRPDVYLDGGSNPPLPIPGVDSGMCDVGDERAMAIYHGTVEPTLLSMTAGQKLAVVMYSTGGGVCSGTVIADRWVLTAKHCNPSGRTSGSIRLGTDPNSPDISIGIARAIGHPTSGNDLMLLELAEPVSGRLPSITPIAWHTGTIDSSWNGRTVECAGYGTQEDGTIGERRFTAQPISGISSSMITVNGEGRRGLCGGDSGGPVFYQDASGVITVLGALLGGDPSCVGEDNYTKVDAGWIEEHVGPPSAPEPEDPCMGLDERGRCMGETAQWCEAGELRAEECGAGTSCGLGPDGHRCIDADTPPGDPCGGVTIQGRCTPEGVAEWCEGGMLRRAHCRRCGMACRPLLEFGGVYCEDPGIPP